MDLVLPKSIFLFNFANLWALLIVLILILVLAYKNFAAKIAPLRNEASSAKSFRSPRLPSVKLRSCCETGTPLLNHFAALRPPSAKIFAAVKPFSGTRVPFRSPSPHFAVAKPSAKPSKASFLSPSTLYETISQLWNAPLAHECHFAAPHSHFTTAKWYAKLPIGCEIAPWLWNKPPPAKISIVT